MSPHSEYEIVRHCLAEPPQRRRGPLPAAVKPRHDDERRAFTLVEHNRLHSHTRSAVRWFAVRGSVRFALSSVSGLAGLERMGDSFLGLALAAQAEKGCPLEIQQLLFGHGRRSRARPRRRESTRASGR